MFERKGPLRQFYVTDTAPCPYLDARIERRIVTPIEPADSPLDFDNLAEAGFRRSQGWLYKPACPACNACTSVRIVVDAFKPSRGFRKILKRNADLLAEERPPQTTDEQFALFERYLRARHADGGMSGMNRREYALMVERAPASTRLFEFRRRDTGELAAVTLTDRTRNGLSGVYKFFDPDEPQRSFGTFIILWHVEQARREGLPYVFLGYWIAASPKMAYKARFHPLEYLDGTVWRALPQQPPAAPPAQPNS